jgi:hypothetical protein
MTAEDGEYWAELERKSNEAARVLLGTAIKRIAQLEAALVEERAAGQYYAWDDEWILYGCGWEGKREGASGQAWRNKARTELEESGILTKLQNGAK